ncbi:MAG: hypothetical protein IJQ93_13320 [Bacteroidales bacterium]|nr:hypothetical protein [Bacteroidales bacterium]
MLLLIMSLLLPFFSGGKNNADAVISSDEGSYCVAEASSGQGILFSGYGGLNSVSVRNTNTGRRTSPQTRSSFRIIKVGKVIDNNRTHPFLTPVFVPLSGMHITERYLFSICRLRL